MTHTDHDASVLKIIMAKLTVLNQTVKDIDMVGSGKNRCCQETYSDIDEACLH